MASFKKGGSIKDFQAFNHLVYGPIDDRFYDVADLLTQHQRFAMRALKGIRKGNQRRLVENLLISFSFLTALANRFRIDLEEETWKRFPALCSYCGKCPCVCKSVKPKTRHKVAINPRLRPKSMQAYQQMFAQIYPPESRTLEHAGIHFAEEVGEVAEAVFYLFRTQEDEQFSAVKIEMADFISCLFGIANSAGFDVAGELAKMYRNNCHVCHKLPCACSFSFISRY